MAEPPSGDPDGNKAWLYSDEAGEPEDVIAYAFRCGKAHDLPALGLSLQPLVPSANADGHGSGAHVLDLGTGQTIDWIDLEHWLTE